MGNQYGGQTPQPPHTGRGTQPDVVAQVTGGQGRDAGGRSPEVHPGGTPLLNPASYTYTGGGAGDGDVRTLVGGGEQQTGLAGGGQWTPTCELTHKGQAQVIGGSSSSQRPAVRPTRLNIAPDSQHHATTTRNFPYPDYHHHQQEGVGAAPPSGCEYRHSGQAKLSPDHTATLHGTSALQHQQAGGLGASNTSLASASFRASGDIPLQPRTVPGLSRTTHGLHGVGVGSPGGQYCQKRPSGVPASPRDYSDNSDIASVCSGTSGLSDRHVTSTGSGTEESSTMPLFRRRVRGPPREKSAEGLGAIGGALVKHAAFATAVTVPLASGETEPPTETPPPTPKTPRTPRFLKRIGQGQRQREKKQEKKQASTKQVKSQPPTQQPTPETDVQQTTPQPPAQQTKPDLQTKPQPEQQPHTKAHNKPQSRTQPRPQTKTQPQSGAQPPWWSFSSSRHQNSTVAHAGGAPPDASSGVGRRPSGTGSIDSRRSSTTSLGSARTTPTLAKRYVPSSPSIRPRDGSRLTSDHAAAAIAALLGDRVEGRSSSGYQPLSVSPAMSAIRSTTSSQQSQGALNQGSFLARRASGEEFGSGPFYHSGGSSSSLSSTGGGGGRKAALEPVQLSVSMGGSTTTCTPSSNSATAKNPLGQRRPLAAEQTRGDGGKPAGDAAAAASTGSIQPPLVPGGAVGGGQKAVQTEERQARQRLEAAAMDAQGRPHPPTRTLSPACDARTGLPSWVRPSEQGRLESSPTVRATKPPRVVPAGQRLSRELSLDSALMSPDAITSPGSTLSPVTSPPSGSRPPGQRGLQRAATIDLAEVAAKCRTMASSAQSETKPEVAHPVVMRRNPNISSIGKRSCRELSDMVSDAKRASQEFEAKRNSQETACHNNRGSRDMGDVTMAGKRSSAEPEVLPSWVRAVEQSDPTPIRTTKPKVVAVKDNVESNIGRSGDTAKITSGVDPRPGAQTSNDPQLLITGGTSDGGKGDLNTTGPQPQNAVGTAPVVARPAATAPSHSQPQPSRIPNQPGSETAHLAYHVTPPVPHTKPAPHSPVTAPPPTAPPGAKGVGGKSATAAEPSNLLLNPGQKAPGSKTKGVTSGPAPTTQSSRAGLSAADVVQALEAPPGCSLGSVIINTGINKGTTHTPASPPHHRLGASPTHGAGDTQRLTDEGGAKRCTGDKKDAASHNNGGVDDKTTNVKNVPPPTHATAQNLQQQQQGAALNQHTGGPAVQTVQGDNNDCCKLPEVGGGLGTTGAVVSGGTVATAGAQLEKIPVQRGHSHTVSSESGVVAGGVTGGVVGGGSVTVGGGVGQKQRESNIITRGVQPSTQQGSHGPTTTTTDNPSTISATYRTPQAPDPQLQAPLGRGNRDISEKIQPNEALTCTHRPKSPPLSPSTPITTANVPTTGADRVDAITVGVNPPTVTGVTASRRGGRPSPGESCAKGEGRGAITGNDAKAVGHTAHTTHDTHGGGRQVPTHTTEVVPRPGASGANQSAHEKGRNVGTGDKNTDNMTHGKVELSNPPSPQSREEVRQDTPEVEPTGGEDQNYTVDEDRRRRGERLVEGRGESQRSPSTMGNAQASAGAAPLLGKAAQRGATGGNLPHPEEAQVLGASQAVSGAAANKGTTAHEHNEKNHPTGVLAVVTPGRQSGQHDAGDGGGAGVDNVSTGETGRRMQAGLAKTSPAPGIVTRPALPTQTLTQTKPQTLIPTKAQMEAQAKPQIQADPHAQTKPQTHTQTQAETQAQAKPQIQAKPQVQTQTQAKPQTQAQARAKQGPAQTQPRAKPQGTSQTHMQEKPQAHTLAQAKPQTQIQTQSKPQVQTHPQMQAQAQTRPQTRAQDKTQTQAQSAQQAKPKTPVQVQAQAQARLQAHAKQQAPAKCQTPQQKPLNKPQAQDAQTQHKPRNSTCETIPGGATVSSVGVAACGGTGPQLTTEVGGASEGTVGQVITKLPGGDGVGGGSGVRTGADGASLMEVITGGQQQPPSPGTTVKPQTHPSKAQPQPPSPQSQPQPPDPQSQPPNSQPTMSQPQPPNLQSPQRGSKPQPPSKPLAQSQTHLPPGGSGGGDVKPNQQSASQGKKPGPSLVEKEGAAPTRQSHPLSTPPSQTTHTPTCMLGVVTVSRPTVVNPLQPLPPPRTAHPTSGAAHATGGTTPAGTITGVTGAVAGVTGAAGVAHSTGDPPPRRMEQLPTSKPDTPVTAASPPVGDVGVTSASPGVVGAVGKGSTFPTSHPTLTASSSGVAATSQPPLPPVLSQGAELSQGGEGDSGGFSPTREEGKNTCTRAVQREETGLAGQGQVVREETRGAQLEKETTALSPGGRSPPPTSLSPPVVPSAPSPSRPAAVTAMGQGLSSDGQPLAYSQGAATSSMVTGTPTDLEYHSPVKSRTDPPRGQSASSSSGQVSPAGSVQSADSMGQASPSGHVSPREQLSPRQQLSPSGTAVPQGGCVPASQQHKRHVGQHGHVTQQQGTQKGHVAQHQGHVAQQQGHVAQQQSHVAQQQGHVAQQQGHVAQQQGHAAQQQGHAVQQQGHATQQQGHVTQQRGHVAPQGQCMIAQANPVAIEGNKQPETSRRPAVQHSPATLQASLLRLDASLNHAKSKPMTVPPGDTHPSTTPSGQSPIACSPVVSKVLPLASKAVVNVVDDRERSGTKTGHSGNVLDDRESSGNASGGSGWTGEPTGRTSNRSVIKVEDTCDNNTTAPWRGDLRGGGDTYTPGLLTVRCDSIDSVGLSSLECPSSGEPCSLDSMVLENQDVDDVGTLYISDDQSSWQQAPGTHGLVIKAPVTHGPVTQGSATHGPPTKAPATQGDVVHGLLTKAPVTQGPPRNASATPAPATQSTMSQRPVTQTPVTQAPVVHSPATQAIPTHRPAPQPPVIQPSVMQPSVMQPLTTHTPVTRLPVTQTRVQPVTHRHAAHMPVTQTRMPVTQTPAIQGHVAHTPATQAPVTQRHVANQPVTQATVTHRPASQAPTIQACVTRAPVPHVHATPVPVTKPPATQPPAMQPPAMQPPDTKPPATKLPVTKYPATQLPATQPLATKLPATQPPTTKPPTSQPPAIQPPATKPPATKPPTTSQTPVSPLIVRLGQLGGAVGLPSTIPMGHATTPRGGISTSGIGPSRSAHDENAVRLSQMSGGAFRDDGGCSMAQAITVDTGHLQHPQVSRQQQVGGIGAGSGAPTYPDHHRLQDDHHYTAGSDRESVTTAGSSTQPSPEVHSTSSGYASTGSAATPGRSPLVPGLRGRHGDGEPSKQARISGRQVEIDLANMAAAARPEIPPPGGTCHVSAAGSEVGVQQGQIGDKVAPGVSRAALARDSTSSPAVRGTSVHYNQQSITPTTVTTPPIGDVNTSVILGGFQENKTVCAKHEVTSSVSSNEDFYSDEYFEYDEDGEEEREEQEDDDEEVLASPVCEKKQSDAESDVVTLTSSTLESIPFCDDEVTDVEPEVTAEVTLTLPPLATCEDESESPKSDTPERLENSEFDQGNEAVAESSDEQASSLGDVQEDEVLSDDRSQSDEQLGEASASGGELSGEDADASEQLKIKNILTDCDAMQAKRVRTPVGRVETPFKRTETPVWGEGSLMVKLKGGLGDGVHNKSEEEDSWVSAETVQTAFKFRPRPGRPLSWLVAQEKIITSNICPHVETENTKEKKKSKRQRRRDKEERKKEKERIKKAEKRAKKAARKAINCVSSEREMTSTAVVTSKPTAVSTGATYVADPLPVAESQPEVVNSVLAGDHRKCGLLWGAHDVGVGDAEELLSCSDPNSGEYRLISTMTVEAQHGCTVSSPVEEYHHYHQAWWTASKRSVGTQFPERVTVGVGVHLALRVASQHPEKCDVALTADLDRVESDLELSADEDYGSESSWEEWCDDEESDVGGRRGGARGGGGDEGRRRLLTARSRSQCRAAAVQAGLVHDKSKVFKDGGLPRERPKRRQWKVDVTAMGGGTVRSSHYGPT